MTMVVTLFVALAVTVSFYAFGQGGPIAGLVFLGILLIGSIVKLSAPAGRQPRP